MIKGKTILIYVTLIIVSTFFLFLGLAEAKTFFVPITTASILTLVMLPLSHKMEGTIGRMAASLINTFILFLISVGFMALVSFQVKSFVSEWPEIKETMKPKVEQVKNFIFQNTPIQEGSFKKSGNEVKFPYLSKLKNAGGAIASFFNSALSTFALYLLTLIYVFFLLNYRKKFKEFLVRLFPEEKKQEVKEVIHSAAKMVQQYIVGKLLMTGILAVFYAVGLGISGVNNFIVISIVAAFLNLIPYIGNIIGFGMAMSFGYLTSGSSGTLIGIIITFAVAQFIESYILEPYVVGDKVKLHPFFVILVVIIGNMIWGIIGMILAIPILAIINVVLLHVPILYPFGFLFSDEGPSKEKGGSS